MVVVDCSTPGGQLQAKALLLAPASGSAIDASLHQLLVDGTLVLHNAHKVRAASESDWAAAASAASDTCAGQSHV
jgi:hypothetical protein